MANLRKTFGKLKIPLLVLLAICFSALPVQAKYGGGTGEPNDPYLIFDANQMNAIGANADDWDKHFLLCADIDLAGFTGTEFNIIGNSQIPFSGVFNGDGKSIYNFTYSVVDARYDVGIFGYVEGEAVLFTDLTLYIPNINATTYYAEHHFVGSLIGYIKNGNILNCHVVGGSVKGREYVGGLVGRSEEAEIVNCSTNVRVDGFFKYVGGLAGYSGGAISNCHSYGSIDAAYFWTGGLIGTNYGSVFQCSASGRVFGGSYDQSVGALIGKNRGMVEQCYATGDVSGYSGEGGLVAGNSGVISNCYATGNVMSRRTLGYSETGGLVGSNSRTIQFCYSIGKVEGSANGVGALVGWKNYGNSHDIVNSFWNLDTAEQIYSYGGIGLTTAEMQMVSTFVDVGWDFETPIWTIDEGVDYPRLWWERPLLHAEPEVTLGTSNTITWDPVPGANDYYAECAEDANFTSIIYNTGWIAETSYEFTGLELGQEYWYSVKAKTASGSESDWSNVESSMQVTLAEAVEAVLDPNSLKNENMKNVLMNKINAVLEMIDAGRYEEALNKLQNDLLQKTNGCADTGQPDKNDWIITCEGQSVLYPLVIETMENVNGLMD